MSISNESGKTSPTTTSSPNTTSLSSTVPTKLCHIVKRPDFDGYGFNLHSEKIKPGQYIGKVDANSPASAAGLKEGDRIIEVNGVPIGSETHKQVVQRIKAISLEVRLLLIDADAPTANINGSFIKNKTSSTTTNPITSNNNNNNEKYQGSVQEMPGASANISTISMVSTKRQSNASSTGSQSTTTTAPVPVTPPTVPIGADVTDRGLVKNGGGIANIDNNTVNASEVQSRQQQQKMTKETQQHGEQESKLQINNNKVITPLPPSATVASAASASSSSANNNSNNNSVNKAGSLQLPMTAAEMRAKLMSKKKYDPKNESVDLKKKFEIIQKL